MRIMTLLLLSLSCLIWGSLAIFLLPAPETRDAETPHNRTLRETPCNADEYEDEESGRCCRMCPAGNYVAQHCLKDHTPALCWPCILGTSYAAGPNGLPECQSCSVCRTDEQIVTPCTPTSNTRCQCRPGTYCPPEGPCEICTRCSSCKEGQRVKEECTANQDTVCQNLPEPQPTSTPPSTLQATTTLPSTNTTPLSRQLTSLTKSSNPDEGLTKSSNPGEEGPFFVLSIIFAVLLLVPIAYLGFWYWKKQRDGTKETISQSSLCQSASASSCSTPLMNNPHPVTPPGPTQPEKESLIPNRDNVTISMEVPLTAGHDTEKRQGSRDQEMFEDSGPTADEDDEGGGVKPCSECDDPPLCDHQWKDAIYIIIRHVHHDIIAFARFLHVDDADIGCIRENFINDIKERNYQLIKQWRVNEGRKASLKTIISTLNKMGLKVYGENIINSLRKDGIPYI